MATQTAPLDHAALWERIVDDPSLRDLPYKVETNAQGQIILSPPKNKHSFLQLRIGRLLEDLANAPGQAAVEFAVQTAEGIKAPDVIWISEERLAEAPEDAASSPVMPEICVEVTSQSNTSAEMQEKRRLYFEGGAEEVWLVTPRGEVTFYDAGGPVEASQRAPGFPKRVEA